MIPVGISDLLPEHLHQARTLDEPHCIIATLSQLAQQRLDHSIKPTFGASTDGKHAQPNLRLGIGGMQKPFQFRHPRFGAVELHMVAHDVFKLRRQTQLAQPARRLIRLEHRGRQLQVQQPVRRAQRLWPVMEHQKLCLRLLA